jgi:hypothetical protein
MTTHTLSISLSLYLCIDWPCFLPRTNDMCTCLWLDHLSSSLLQPSPFPKDQSNNIYPQHIYLFSEYQGTLTLSLYLCLDWPRFSCRLFHTLKLPLHPSQSWSYLHCEGDSNLRLICEGIYSGGFRIYFCSIRPTTTPNTVATPAPPPMVFPLDRSPLSRTPFLTFHVAPWYFFAKNSGVLFNYYK